MDYLFNFNFFKYTQLGFASLNSNMAYWEQFFSKTFKMHILHYVFDLRLLE